MDDGDLLSKGSSKMSSMTAEPTMMTEAVNHGAEIIFKFPKIPCSKYTVMGNSKMRVKRERRHRDTNEPVWRVPKLVQTTLAAKIRREPPLDTAKRVAGDGISDSVERRHPFRNQAGLNSQDKASLYAAKFEDSFKGPEVRHTPKMVTLVDDSFKTEKRYIAKFYRQRSSTLLSPIQKKRPSRTVSISLPSVVQEYDLTDHPDAIKVTRPGRADEKRQSTIQLDKYHTRECLFCDVAGQKYCSECRRKHRHIKMRESSPKTVKFPKLPSCHVQKIDTTMSSANDMSGSGEQRTEKFQRYRNKDWRNSSSFDEPPAHFKGSVKGKGRKAKAKYTILPRIDLPAITTDTDNRHL